MAALSKCSPIQAICKFCSIVCWVGLQEWSIVLQNVSVFVSVG